MRRVWEMVSAELLQIVQSEILEVQQELRQYENAALLSQDSAVGPILEEINSIRLELDICSAEVSQRVCVCC